MLRVVEVFGDTFFEHGIGLLFQNTETWQVGRRPVLLVEACEIKAFMTSKRFVRDDLNVVIRINSSRK
jgi:hypothetical protein